MRREVATWVLSVGGGLDIEKEDGSIQQGVKLLPPGPFWVSFVGLGKPEILDGDLYRFRGLQRLKSIRLVGGYDG